MVRIEVPTSSTVWEVKASVLAHGSLLAERVKREDDHDNGNEVEITAIPNPLRTRGKELFPVYFLNPGRLAR